MTLLVADQHASKIYALNPASRHLKTVGENTVLAEHSGFVQVGEGVVAYADDARGEVVLMQEKRDADLSCVKTRISASIPAEHIAVSPHQRWIALTTGLGAS